MNPEIEALRHENELLRNLCQSHELDRDAKEYYERLLTDIGKSIGCGHIDDRLPSCVDNAMSESKEAIDILRRIVARNGVTPQGVQQIEKWLKEHGAATRQG